MEVGDPRQGGAKWPARVQQLPFPVPEDEPRSVGQGRRGKLTIERLQIPRVQRRRGSQGFHPRDRGRDLPVGRADDGARDRQRAVLDRPLLERGPVQRQPRREDQASHDAHGGQRQKPRPHPYRRRGLWVRLALRQCDLVHGRSLPSAVAIPPQASGQSENARNSPGREIAKSSGSAEAEGFRASPDA